MALAITDPDLLFLALDLVEAARDDGLFIPAFGSLAHQTEIADVMLLVVERADYTSVQCVNCPLSPRERLLLSNNLVEDHEESGLDQHSSGAALSLD